MSLEFWPAHPAPSEPATPAGREAVARGGAPEFRAGVARGNGPRRRARRWVPLVPVLLGLAGGAAWGSEYRISTMVPPAPAREFRGVWIATVANIDWPSKPGLSTEEQKLELLRILDRAAQLKLNAVVLQVRPACDAMYASAIEPWSEYLTGVMGRAPSPFYDPLAFAVEQAHKRGLELHAWFNPYRALHFSSKSQPSATHVSRTHPEFVKRYGRYLWLDPGEPGVRAYSLSVVMDVVRRYDIDGVHFDDYFYPDPADAGSQSGFPDDSSWKTYGAAARRAGMSREDWRRQNVNTFVEGVYRAIKAAKPWVKFGISPLGIWRPGNPAQIKGMDAYATLYADSRKWFAAGWLDYFSPQLYWPMASREQNFGALLEWWERQNGRGRHLWPGLYASKAEQWSPDEIPGQIRLLRREPGASGYICYSAGALLRNASLSAALEEKLNVERALVPPSPWLSTNTPAKPALFLNGQPGGDLRMMLGKPSQRDQTRWWLIQTRQGDQWKTEILSGQEWEENFGRSRPDAISVCRIDRLGVSSRPVVFEKKELTPAASASAHEFKGSN